MGRLEVDTVIALQAQIATLTKKIGNFTHNTNATPTSESYNLIGYFNNDFCVSDAGFIGDGYIE